MRTAKELFQASPAFKEYAAWIDSPVFDLACHAALQDFLESMPATTAQPSEAWDSHCRIVGARLVLERLSRLHEKPEPPKPDPIAWQRPKPKGT